MKTKIWDETAFLCGCYGDPGKDPILTTQTTCLRLLLLALTFFAAMQW